MRSAHRRRAPTGSSSVSARRSVAGADAQRVGEQPARAVLQVALGRRPEQQQPATGRQVVDQPLLHRGVEVPTAGQRHQRRAAAVGVLQVDRPEPVAGEQQRPPQRPALARHRGAPRGRRRPRSSRAESGWWYSVAKASRTNPSARRRAPRPCRPSHRSLQPHGVHGPGRRGEGQAPLARGADRGRRPVPLAGEADPVVAVADRLVQRRVDAAGEEVVVDHPVALGQEQPGLEVDGRGVVLSCRRRRRSRPSRPRTPGR